MAPTRSPDLTRDAGETTIDVADVHALRDWAARLMASPDMVRQAVEVVGARSDAVEAYLRVLRGRSLGRPGH